MKSSVPVGFLFVVLAIAGCGGGGSGGGSGGGGITTSTGDETVFAITTNNRLISFDPGTPGTLRSSRPVTGLVAGESLAAIDNRPGTGDLYALGASSRIYAIDSRTGVATQVGVGEFTPALAGTSFGFDFNPVVDRVRVVSDTDQNLRVQPATGQVVAEDVTLSYFPTDPSNAADPTLVAAAYTNGYAGANSTTLYAIDSGVDALVLQGSPGGAPLSPNAGVLFTVGPLGVDVSSEAGFDISPFGGAFASLTAPGATDTQIYVINLDTGTAGLLGTIGGGLLVRDIAIVPPARPRVFAITADNDLVSFRPATPNVLLSSVHVTGLRVAEELLGLDFRPATGTLIALGDTSRVYEINTTNGAATEIGSAQFSPLLEGNEFGVDLNPVPDRLRIVSDADQNLRVNPSTGTVAATDAVLSYDAGDTNVSTDPSIVAVAYTDNYAGTKSTTQYGIDSDLDVLVRQGSTGGLPQSPNTGVLFTVGALGVDASPLVGFDVSCLGGAFASITSPGGTDSQFYAINLESGTAGLLGSIGAPAPVRDIAIEPPAAPVLYAVTSSNRLVSFLAGEPQELIGDVALTGLQAGESVLAIDFRPATRELFALGSSSRLYRINRTNGAAARVADTAFSTALAGAAFGFEFNPTVDRIRVVSDNDQNLRVHPTTGAIVSVDATLAYAAGDLNSGANPSIAALAHSSNFAGATSTTLYGIDTSLDALVRLGTVGGTLINPNGGTLFTVGGLNVDASDLAGFDITMHGGAFAVMTAPAASASQLYSISLSTGQATLIGPIGGTATVRGLAAVPAGL